jgi:hypothetical protein
LDFNFPHGWFVVIPERQEIVTKTSIDGNSIPTIGAYSRSECFMVRGVDGWTCIGPPRLKIDQ